MRKISKAFLEWEGIITSDYKRGRFPKLFRNGKVLLRQIITEEDFKSLFGMGRDYYVRLKERKICKAFSVWEGIITLYYK